MKKIILSAVVTAMALSTTASALEDIKVKGQAKLWYETNNGGDISMFSKDTGNGEFTLKLDVTGKQGDVGFGATLYDSSTMGLENQLVKASRSGFDVADNGLFLGQAYITAPLGSKTIAKIGKQELNTPFAFTEKWASVNNSYNAAVVVNNSISNLTLIAAYVGQTNGWSYAKNSQNFGDTSGNSVNGGDLDTFAIAGLYKNDTAAVNAWAYNMQSANGMPAGSTMAYWVDASTKISSVSLKAYAAMIDPSTGDSGTAFALSAGTKVGAVKLFAAASTVSEDGVAFGNKGTADKKTKLPTMGVYTDGKYVAQSGSTAFKLKAAGKVAGTGVALQGVMNDNDTGATAGGDSASEIDLILSKKLGDFNVKAILMHRDWDDMDAQQHIRVVTSVNF